ncbi:MAG: ATPase involved in chromosome partitioning [Ilumatobacteraceae bacterium]|nr:ATPase involved in chromosome partitioning [Ilumatobacteraceae bacterium]
MLTVCWAAKGGSGTTVVSCALALLLADEHESSWLLDAAGDVPAALGIAEPSGPGLLDWVSSTSAPPNAIDALGVAASPGLRVVPRGTATVGGDHARWRDIGQHLADRAVPCVVDAGTGAPPDGLLMAAQHRLLVIRPCYLALRRATASGLTPTAVVVVHEPGRALRADDVAAAVHAPVVAEISLDPAVARAVDAGLLLARMPRPLSFALRSLVG